MSTSVPLERDRAVIRRLRATVEYDGTNFAGFQRQASTRTVQGVLEEALVALMMTAGVVASGRTDAGVHATGQVIHFDYYGAIPTERIAVALNGRLPADVAIRDCMEVPPHFHARYSALSRVYRYDVFIAANRQPLRERYAWRLADRLEMSCVQHACQILVGQHCFRHFGQIPGNSDQRLRSQQHRGWNRTILSAQVLPIGDAFRLVVEADAFLTHMMRAIVGTVVAIGQGRLTLQALQAALEHDQSSETLAPLAPPHGLCLALVRYPD